MFRFKSWEGKESSTNHNRQSSSYSSARVNREKCIFVIFILRMWDKASTYNQRRTTVLCLESSAFAERDLMGFRLCTRCMASFWLTWNEEKELHLAVYSQMFGLNMYLWRGFIPNACLVVNSFFCEKSKLNANNMFVLKICSVKWLLNKP